MYTEWMQQFGKVIHHIEGFSIQTGPLEHKPAPLGTYLHQSWLYPFNFPIFPTATPLGQFTLCDCKSRLPQANHYLVLVNLILDENMLSSFNKLTNISKFPFWSKFINCRRDGISFLPSPCYPLILVCWPSCCISEAIEKSWCHYQNNMVALVLLALYSTWRISLGRVETDISKRIVMESI